MIQTIENGARTGNVKVPASKSQAHRALIVSALGCSDTTISCDGISKDIEATVNCLNALGANISVDGKSIHVSPIKEPPQGVCRLECGESGSTLRFMLPLVGALGANAVFYPKGRLIDRPLAPLDSQLISHGMTIEKTDSTIICSGKLTGGEYEIAGNVSSQYISGLLMALPALPEPSKLTVTGDIQSLNYIKMTEEVLQKGNVPFERSGNVYSISGGKKPEFPDFFEVEGDYSSASFFLCMGALSQEGITVKGLSSSSCQGDRELLSILTRFGADVSESEAGVTVKKNHLRGITIDASQIPDIIPPICAVAAVCQGKTEIINAKRLRIKESDRIETTVSMLLALGADAVASEDGIVITGKPSLAGGTVESYNDHRIAMSAAVAACVCSGQVTVNGAECVSKSYPNFWDDLSKLRRVL